MAFVADNSIIIAWFIEGQANAYTNALRDRSAGEAVHVPALWRAEFSNAILVLVHRRRIAKRALPRIIDHLDALDIVTDPAPPSVRALTALARRYALSAYDASYLELALRLKLFLAARDNPLRKAADRAGCLLG